MYSKGAPQYVIVVFSVGVVIRSSRSYKKFLQNQSTLRMSPASYRKSLDMLASEFPIDYPDEGLENHRTRPNNGAFRPNLLLDI